MTRINLVPPSELHRKHLQAEYYELPEIFRLVRARQAKGFSPTTMHIPSTYRFGEGHKTFFYDKLKWLAWRHLALKIEMKCRGYSVNMLSVTSIFSDLDPYWWGDWTPSEADIQLSRDRIEQRKRELGWLCLST